MKSFVKSEPTPVDGVTVDCVTTVAPAAETPAPPTAVAVRPGMAVTNPGNAMFEGEVDASDIRKPTLTIVHGVGPRSAIFTPGTVVLGDSIVYGPPVPPSAPTKRVRIVFGRVVKDYVQNLPYNEGASMQRPAILKTLKEVQSIGGTTEWNGNTPPTFLKRVSGVVLARCPAECEDDSLFSIIDGEHTYAPALVVFSKTSYPAATTILTDLMMRLKGDPTGAFYDLFWVKEKKGNNIVACAKLDRVNDERPSDVLKARLGEICGRTQPALDAELD